MTKLCYRYNLTTSFRPIEVPPTAKFIDSLVIGTNAVEELGLSVNVWGLDTSLNSNADSLYIFMGYDMYYGDCSTNYLRVCC